MLKPICGMHTALRREGSSPSLALERVILLALIFVFKKENRRMTNHKRIVTVSMTDGWSHGVRNRRSHELRYSRYSHCSLTLFLLVLRVEGEMEYYDRNL